MELATDISYLHGLDGHKRTKVGSTMLAILKYCLSLQYTVKRLLRRKQIIDEFLNQ